jgi:hypothetical protein
MTAEAESNAPGWGRLPEGRNQHFWPDGLQTACGIFRLLPIFGCSRTPSPRLPVCEVCAALIADPAVHYETGYSTP